MYKRTVGLKHIIIAFVIIAAIVVLYLLIGAPPSKRGGVPERSLTNVTFIGNSSTKKFHKPQCAWVSQMLEENRVYFYGDRQEVIDKHYKPCGHCDP